MQKAKVKLSSNKIITQGVMGCLQLSKTLSNVGRGLIRKGDFQGRGFSRSKGREMLPAPSVSLEELETFESVARNGGGRLAETFLVLKRNMEVSEYASQQISIGQRQGATEMSNAVHVLQNVSGIVYGVASHKTIDGLKSNRIGGFFGVIFGEKMRINT